MGKYTKVRSTMPSNHSERDSEWIDSVLLTLSPSHQLKARVAYSEAYSDAFNNEEIKYKKENKARHAANQRLRSFRDKCHKTYAQGRVQVAKQQINDFDGF